MLSHDARELIDARDQADAAVASQDLLDGIEARFASNTAIADAALESVDLLHYQSLRRLDGTDLFEQAVDVVAELPVPLARA
jgi:hypothetical protein